MKLQNCSECGKIYLQTMGDLCPNCVMEEDDDFKKIKELVLELKHSFSAEELHEKTGVSMKRIIKFIRQGRLQFANIQLTLTCESCGEPIEEGRYCSNCKAKMLQELHGDSVQEGPDEPKDTKTSSRNSRMFIADLTGKNRR